MDATSDMYDDFPLTLSPVEAKVTRTALQALFDDLGHEEHDVREIVRRVLDRLPDEHLLRAIPLP